MKPTTKSRTARKSAHRSRRSRESRADAAATISATDGTAHNSAISLDARVAEYGPDTGGDEMPEPTATDPAEQKARDVAYLERQKARAYHGAPVPATAVYRRRMDEF